MNTKTEDSVAATSGTQKDGAFTGRAGVVYLSDIGLAPYVSYSESFLPALGTDAAGRAFEPETGRQYEIGMKYQPPGANSFVTIAAFDLQRQNVLTTDPGNPLAQIQTGEITTRGFEFEAVADLGSGLNLIGAYTFLDAEVTKSSDADLGKRPIAVPEHAASFWADYTMQEGSPIPGFGFGGGIRYIGPSFGNDVNTLEVPGYALTDAALHYDWGDFRFALNASNIFDKQFVASCFSEASCFYGARRTIVGTIRYRW